MPGDQGPTSQLRRILGPVDATCIVVGAIVGVGIFFTPSSVARLAESGGVALLAWTVGGVIAMAGALTFAELGGLYPRTAGQYAILRDAYGPGPAFLYVFCNATAIQAGAVAIIAIVCAQHLAQAVGGTLEGMRLFGVAATLIVGLIVANAAGVRWGAGIQNATVFAKVATLLVVTLMAVFAGDAGVAVAPAGDVGAASPGLGVIGLVFAALVPAFFSFGGWQHALWIGGEIRDPARNVPRAIVVGVGIVVVVYVLVNWAYLRLLGYDGVVGSPALAADAVAVVSPGLGPGLVAAAVAVSAFGVLNAQLLSGPRLVQGMAADGRFFRVFAVVDARFATPIPAILLIGVMALALLGASHLPFVGSDPLDQLLTGVVLIDGLFFALTGAALIVLRFRRPDETRPVRVPLYPFVPVLFVLGELGIVAGAYLDPEARKAALVGLAWIVVAGACYLVFFRGTSADHS